MTTFAEATSGIRKPLPPSEFVVHDTNAEMRWDATPTPSVTPTSRVFVRNHTETPSIDPASYALEIYGDGLVHARDRDDPVRLTLTDLRALPVTRTTLLHECTGNGRRFFASQQGTPIEGTQWDLGGVAVVQWEGVLLSEVFERVGVAGDARDVLATGLDGGYVEDGVDYGPVRRPFPVAKADDDALLVWGMNGEELPPDHGAPLRLVLPGWVGVGSIKWLGTLEVSTRTLTSPWNTKWYRMTGGDHPEDEPMLTTLPVRSAWELPEEPVLSVAGGEVLYGRSWSGAGPIERVEVSADGGNGWTPARLLENGPWARWEWTWPGGPAGRHDLMARATDVAGHTQPLHTPYNDGGYCFDAVVRRPVTVR